MVVGERPERTVDAGAGGVAAIVPLTGNADDPPRVRRIGRWLGPRNIGAIYVLVVICIVFSLWAPDTFPTTATIRELLNDNAVEAMAALALLLPLAARTFDLSFAYTMSLSGVTAADLVVNYHVNVFLSFVVAICVAAAIGVMNGIVVVVMRIDSFIATLATGSLIQAFINYFTNGGIDINSNVLSGSFAKLGRASVGGVTAPVFCAAAVAIVLWFVMEHTPTGRRMYAVGFNIEAAKLANIRADRLRFTSLIFSGAIAGLAGIVLASQLGAGSTTAGTSYLLPAYAAAFVGATQFKGGRPNAWGTVVAVLMLGTGILGLGLASAPSYSANLFTGVVMVAALAAVGMRRRTLRQGRGSRSTRLRSLLGLGGSEGRGGGA